MTEPHVFILADTALNNVVQQIDNSQWGMCIPSWVPLSRTVDREAMTLRTLINYHAYDDIWVPSMLQGKTMDEVGKDRWKNEDLLGENPKLSFADIVRDAIAAARLVTDAQLNESAHLSFGDFSVQEYFWQINQFRALRAYEIARMIGADSTLPHELVQGVFNEVAPNVEAWRAMGVFGVKVEVPESSSLQDKLLGLTGRSPQLQSNL
jgi:hypothetical protein